MTVPQDDAVAVLVDVQEKLFPHIYEHHQLAENIVKLLKGLQVLDIPLIVTQQYTKGLGATIHQLAEVIGEFNAIEKLAFSCFGDSDFVEVLESVGKYHVILAGIEAHVCVLQTALDLLEEVYQPVLVEDCISSRKPNDKRWAVERMRDEGVFITTYESILFELCKIAGTEQFKSISKIVK